MANRPEPGDPRSYDEAISDTYRKINWQVTMEEEIQSLLENDTWTLVDLPKGRFNLLDGKWVFKTKRGVDGKVAHFKA